MKTCSWKSYVTLKPGVDLRALPSGRHRPGVSVFREKPSHLGGASTSDALETKAFQYFCVPIIPFMRFLEETSNAGCLKIPKGK